MEIGVFVNMPMLSFDELREEFLFYSKKGVNLMGFPFDYPTGPHNVDEKWIKRLEDVVKGLGIKTAIHAPFTSTNILSVCKEHRRISVEEIKLSIELAKKLGSHSVVFHAGYINIYSAKKDLYKAYLNDSITEILQYAKKSEVSVAVENLPAKSWYPKSYPSTEEEFLELVKISKDIRFCIDTGHLYRSKINVYKFIKKFISRTICIHLHDATREEDHLVIGKGKLDFRKIFSILDGYSGIVLLENISKKDIIKSYNTLKKMGIVN